jgi:hypothetical protein
MKYKYAEVHHGGNLAHRTKLRDAQLARLTPRQLREYALLAHRLAVYPAYIPEVATWRVSGVPFPLYVPIHTLSPPQSISCTT